MYIIYRSYYPTYFVLLLYYSAIPICATFPTKFEDFIFSQCFDSVCFHIPTNVRSTKKPYVFLPGVLSGFAISG